MQIVRETTTNRSSRKNHVKSLQLFKRFDENILIVLSKQMVTNIEPVGENQEEVFVEPGRTFDELVADKKKGIYVV